MLTCRSTTISEPEARLSISLNQAHDTSGLPPIDKFLLSKENDYLILVHLYMSFGKVNPPSSCCCTWITNKRKQGIVGFSRDASLFINQELSVFNKTWNGVHSLLCLSGSETLNETCFSASLADVLPTLTALSSSSVSVVFVGTCLQT